MNRIGDLQTLFTATQQTAGSDATSSTKGRSQSLTSSSTDRGLGGVDSSVVSSAGGSLVAALSESDVRMDKVVKLQAAIASGTYNVSSSDVAASIINSLLGRN